MNKSMLIFLTFVVALFSACDKGNGVDPMQELPKLSISNVTLFEGNENNVFAFKVITSAVFEEEISVDYAVEEVTAGKEIDFEDVAGSLSIPAGEREGLIEIVIIGDSIKEPDEQFKVVLSNPKNATIQNSEGLGTIRNDDTFVEVPQDGYTTPESYVGYNLIWQDEFSGTAINTANWTHETGAGGWGNQESQYYTDRAENSWISNGNLIIEAREESFSGSEYTSARMITKDKQIFQFGRIDIRAILPEGQGIWPALWMLGNNISTVGWPACGEIDIMELVGHEPSTTHGTAHWGPQGQSQSTYKGAGFDLSDGKFSDKFNVFSLIWEPGSIKWLVNDNQFFSLTNSDVNGAYPFDNEFFFIFNIAVGGQWPGYPDATTQFPQQMVVDYIRVFQEK